MIPLPRRSSSSITIMFLSEKEFGALLAKNPALKVSSFSSEDKNAESLPKSPKYWNVKVYVYEDGFVAELKTLDGHGKIVDHFDSRREYFRFLQLSAMQKAGEISDLSRQTSLEITPAFQYREEKIRPIKYRADFTYIQNGEYVVEDVKGLSAKTGKHLSTNDFKLKWKLLKQRYPEYRFAIF